MNTFDLNSITWGEPPRSLRVVDSLYHEVEKDNEHFKAGTQFFLSLEGEPAHYYARLTISAWSGYKKEHCSTGDTQNWPYFDRIFGRKAWQSYLDQQLPILIDAFGIDDDDEWED